MSTLMAPYLFSVEQFELMYEHLILGPEPKTELIHGHIVERSRQIGRDIICLSTVNRSVFRQIRDEHVVMIRGPLRMPELMSIPMPDLTILRVDFNDRLAPGAEDAIVVGEVSVSTVDVDRAVKLPLYAAAGIPEAWLFNLVAVRIERHTDPQPGGYRTVAFAEAGQRLESTLVSGLVFDTDELIIRVTRA